MLALQIARLLSPNSAASYFNTNALNERTTCEKGPPYWEAILCIQALASLEAEAGNITEARKLFARALAVPQQKDAVLYQASASLEWAAGNVRTAREIFQAGVEHCPPNETLYNAWATLEVSAYSSNLQSMTDLSASIYCNWKKKEINFINAQTTAMCTVAHCSCHPLSKSQTIICPEATLFRHQGLCLIVMASYSHLPFVVQLVGMNTAFTLWPSPPGKSCK